MNRTFQLNMLALVAASIAGCAQHSGAAGTLPDSDRLPLQDQTGVPDTIVVSSPDFDDGGELERRFSFDQFGCVGDNEAPTITWDGVPGDAQSYVVIIHDPDAPTGVGFFHRVVINLPASTRSLGAVLPGGAVDLHTDYGDAGYGGPCPPRGPAHRYIFSVYALDVPRLELPETATGALTRYMLREHAIARGRIVGTFSR